jgi:natural product precursor
VKQKEFSKKLSFNKTTVAHLDTKNMKMVKGGDLESLDCWPTGEPATHCCPTHFNCPPIPTNYTCICGQTDTCYPTIKDTYYSCIEC